MKILFSHRYYWPDPSPYAAILRDIAHHFAGLGHEVTVFTVADAQSSQSITGQEVKIAAVKALGARSQMSFLAGLDAIWYCASLFIYILKSDADVVVAASYPPVLAAWVAGLACRIRRKRFIYHVQDVHPEVSVLSAGFMGHKFLYPIFRYLDNQTLRRSEAVVALSSDMAAMLQKRSAHRWPIHIINNFAPNGGSFALLSEELEATKMFATSAARCRHVGAPRLDFWWRCNPKI